MIVVQIMSMAMDYTRSFPRNPEGTKALTIPGVWNHVQGRTGGKTEGRVVKLLGLGFGVSVLLYVFLELSPKGSISGAFMYVYLYAW